MEKKNFLVNNFFYIFIFLMCIFPLNVHAATHDFSLSAFDWDPTANDWAGDGTGDEIADGDYVEPGQVIMVSVNYAPGDITVKGLQVGINYDSTFFEPLYADGDLYLETDMSTTYQGGIWPAAGTTPTMKKKTNWVVQYNDYNNSQIRILASDSKVATTLEESGTIATFYLKVKDDATAGAVLNLEIDNNYTTVENSYEKTVSGISFTVFGTMSTDVSLATLTLQGSNSLFYTFSPAFTAGTSERTFTTVVPYNVTSITLAATPTDPLATVLSGGLGSKSLSVGDNSFNIVVQAQNGTQEIYLIKVKRLSNDATLKTLSLSGVTLDYELTNSVLTYTATVPYAINSTTVSATANDQNATIKSGTGAWSLSNYGSTVNTKKITVEAENCNSPYSTVPGNTCTSLDYNLNVTRIAPSSDNNLTDIKIDGTSISGFSSNVITYTLPNQANSKSSMVISATLSDSKASVAGVGTKTLVVGDNSFDITVTAEDGSKKTYTIKVRRLSNNANLATLNVTSTPQGTLSPNFNPTFYNYYTYTYDSTVTNINVAATLEDTNATITSGLGNYSSSDTGANVVVTAEDGSIKTYVIKFSRNKSSDNNLSSLSIDGYSLNESFSSSTTLYTATVPGTVSTINVNATANDSNATVTSGVGSHSLNYGANTIQIRVTAENGSTKDYTLIVTRSKKTISALSDLKVDGTTVSGFNENTLTYDYGTVSFETSSVVVSATAKDSDATITGDGTISLKTGDNTIPIVVTAQDGTTKTTYNIKIYRTKSNNAYLGSLSMDEATITFNKNQNTYNVDVPYETTKATIHATAEYKDATVSINGPSFLSIGHNTYTITVTAEDGTINTYTINVKRKLSTNNYASSLTVTKDGINHLNNFKKETTTYNVTVPNEVDHVSIGAVLEDSLNSVVVGTGEKDLSTGLNVCIVEITAASGDIKTYTINITRSLNANNKLASLEVVDQTMSPSFSPNTTSYNVTVESSVSNIAINATPEVATSSVAGTGTHSLQTGTNTFNIEVTAENSDVKTYVVIVTKKASNDSTLKTLSIDETILNETFSPSTTSYTASVANDVSQVTIQATANDIKAKSVEGVGVVNLKTGDNTVNIVVTAEDNTKTTYTIIINRAKSMNANLRSLALSGGYTFDQEFNKNTTNYTVTVPNSTSTVLVSAEKEDATATVTGTGTVNLNTGDNTVNVVVTAEDSSVKKTYTIKIYRMLSSNANLSSLSSTDGLITPAFDKDTKDYTLTVPYEVENANVTAVKEDSSANVVINGNTGLQVGTNNATITVTAEDGTINTYNLVITRQPSSNNYLSSLEVLDSNSKNYIEVFNKNTMTYNIKVENNIDKLTINATAEDSATTIKGLGEKTLVVGNNTFTVNSISANGTSRDYIINIERNKNSNTKLSSLSIDGQILVPDFNPDTFSYSLNVDSSVEEVTIQATTEASTSTVTGLGKKSLQTGLNTFSIDVEAEDGSKKTYVISINKAASSNNYLASLLADQAFTPAFDRDTLNYSVTVGNEIDEITVQAVAEDVNATVSGVGTQPLSVGNNPIQITVTAENNTFRIYTINVTREANDNNYLSDLKVNGNTVPNFDRETLKYTMTVPNDVTEAVVSATKEAQTSTITGEGTTYLVTTSLNTIDVVVTAENGTTKIYTIEITREKSSNNNLTILQSLEGSLSPNFDKTQTNYTMQVPYEITSLTLTTVAEDANATVEVEGNVDFQIGNSNMVYITVTAEDDTTKTYQIQVTRLPQANNFLSSLTVTSATGKSYDLNPTFNKNTLNYTITIPEEDNNLVINGTKEAVSSSVSGFGNVEVSTFPYTHQVVVTSAGGVDRTYTILINRAKSSNANLKGISVSEGSLSPSFSENTTNYTVNVSSNVSSIDISATLNKGQTITNTGTHNLNYGDNEINLSVTAEDGTIKVYTINVVRDNEILPTLSNIQITNGVLSPTFDSETVNYVAYLSQDAEDITITPIVGNVLSKMTISLNDGEYKEISSIKVDDLTKGNVVKIKVEGTTKDRIYTVSILKQSNEKITSKVYGHDISDEMIKTVKIDTSANDLKDQLDNDNSKLKIYEEDGKTEYTGNSVGTGMIVKLIEDDIVLDQKTIVVKGDTDGNGVINAIDSLKVVNHILESELLIDAYLEAADTSDDNIINAIDALKIVNHIIGNISLY